MESLPVDVLALMGLDMPSLAALACTSRTMRDSVADVMCRQGLALPEQYVVSALAHPRFGAMRSLCLNGPCRPHSMAASPVPVPRDWPCLRDLHLRACRPYDPQFWTLIATRAPNLARLVVEPVFHIPNYNVVMDSCDRMMRALPSLPHLTTLSVCGTGLALSQTPCEIEGRLPAIRHLTITGRQLYPRIDAPLDTAVLEESDVPCVGMVQGLGPSAHGMSQLTWSVPIATWIPVAPTLSRFCCLTRLDVTVRNIRCVGSLGLALETLGHVPASLTHLAVSLEFGLLSGEDPFVDFDVAPLRHLGILKELAVCLTFPTQGCGPLVSHLLGVPASSPTSSLQRATLRALHGPADRLKHVRDVAYDEEQADPEDSEMILLEEEIEDIEANAVVPTDFVVEALTRFPHTHFVVDGFNLDDVCRHARLSHVPPNPAFF